MESQIKFIGEHMILKTLSSNKKNGEPNKIHRGTHDFKNLEAQIKKMESQIKFIGEHMILKALKLK